MKAKKQKQPERLRTSAESKVMLILAGQRCGNATPDCVTIPHHMAHALRKERGIGQGTPLVLDGVRLVT